MQSRVLGNPSPTSSLRPLSRLRVAHSSNWDPHGLPKQRSIESRKKRCKISQLLKPLSTSPGHFSDRTFFVTPAVTRFSSLLSVINIDSLIVCLQEILLSFILLLCSGKLPLRWRENLRLYNKIWGFESLLNLKMKTNKPSRTGNTKTGTIAIPRTHSPVASNLDASHPKQSKPRASYFVSWNHAIVP